MIRKAITWLLEELTECIRIGQMFIDSIPNYYRVALDEGSHLSGSYKELLGVYWNRVDCLRHALSLPTRWYDEHALYIEVSAAVRLAENSYNCAAGFGNSDRPEAVEQAVERFERAARVLSKAFAAEYSKDPGQSPPEALVFELNQRREPKSNGSPADPSALEEPTPPDSSSTQSSSPAPAGSPKGNKSPKAADEQPINPIPPEHRTRPMSQTEASRAMGCRGNRKVSQQQMSRFMKKGKVRYFPLSSQKFIFDMRDFPLESHPKIRPG